MAMETDDFEDDFIYTEYAIDDSLSSLERLEKYHNSEFSLQRLVLVRDIYDTAVESGYKESAKRLLSLLNHFVADPEPAVRQVFAEQLFPLAAFFLQNAENETGYNELVNTFLPYAFELIIDKNLEVGQAATEALIKMADLIKKEHIEPQLLSVIVNLAHDERVEEYRIAAARLFNELACVFGEKICKQVIVDELVVMSEDASLLVRKAVAHNIGKLCKIIGGETIVNKILPMYMKLCKDEIWGVRKACAETAPAISLCLPVDVRAKTMAAIFKSFMEDISRWVKIEAFKQLGPFIATFRNVENTLNDDLVHSYTNMAFQSGDQVDNDMVEFCAFNFPGVVLTLGKEKWNLLEHAYVTLTKDVQWKVRRSLAFSLHEIASILGQDLSETVLARAFEQFLKDLDEVKIGAVSNLTKFMEQLSGKMRTKYLQMICNLPEENENWRIRQELGKQLGSLCQLFTAQQVRAQMLALVYALYNDPFAEVRNAAIPSCGQILKKLSTDADGEHEFVQFLQSLAKGKFFARQLFIKGCQYLSMEVDPQVFETEFLPIVEQLCTDKIANVRLAVAMLVNNYLLQQEHWKENTKVLQLRGMLKQDGDKDVKFFANSAIVLKQAPTMTTTTTTTNAAATPTNKDAPQEQEQQQATNEQA